MKSSFGWDENGNGSNSSGFAGFPGGERDVVGTFNGVGREGSWWSATELDSVPHMAVSCELEYDRQNHILNGVSKRYALSVRCLGD